MSSKQESQSQTTKVSFDFGTSDFIEKAHLTYLEESLGIQIETEMSPRRAL